MKYQFGVISNRLGKGELLCTSIHTTKVQQFFHIHTHFLRQLLTKSHVKNAPESHCLTFGSTLLEAFSLNSLLEGVLAQPLASDGKILHVGGNRLAQVLVHIELGKVLAKHEAMTTQARQQADFGINDVTRLNVVASPHCMEADGRQIGNPVGKHLAHHLEEGLTVILQVLACLIGVAVG